MFKKPLFFVNIAAWVITILALSGSSILYAAENETLIIGMQDNTQTLDPAKAVEISSIAIIDQLYDRLVSFKSENLSQPDSELAETWELSEDGKTWTFHLRKGVSFPSGNPVNADAVVFSFRRAMKLNGLEAWRFSQFGITEESIIKIDDSTVQIVLSQQYAPGLLFSSLSRPIASILDPAVVMAHEQNGDMGSAWLNLNSAGSGRFILEERKPGESTILKANQQYWGTPPSAETVEIKNIQEPVDQAIALGKGEIDVAWNLQPLDVKRLENNFDIGIYDMPTLKVTYVVMNLAYEPLAKSEVRDAIRYAIDYDGIAEFIMEGTVDSIQTFIPKGMPAHSPENPYDLAPDTAAQLLQDSGYTDGFEVELLCYNYSPWTDIAFQIKRDLSQVGIKVNVNAASDTELWGAVDAKEFQLFLADWEFSDLDPDPCAKAFAYSDSLGDDAEVKLLAWASQYHNPDVKALVEQAERELDAAKREELYKEVVDIVLDDGPYAILFTPLKQYAVRLEVQDLLGVPSPLMSGLPTIR